MDGFSVFLILVIVIVAIFDILNRRREETPHQRDIRLGPLNPELFCPHCQSKGHVRTKWVSQKAGVSGSKATTAVLTGGLSLLAVGLSRKQELTQAHCDNCNSTWLF